MDDAAIVILAGGNATRFPDKLAYPIDGVPLLLHVVRNMRATAWPVYLACRGEFPPAILANLDVPMLLDERPGAGPLAALISACRTVEAPRIFAVAGDAPRVDGAVLQGLYDAWQAGDEAAIARHGERIEPLAALYAKGALEREGATILQEGNASMHGLIERLRARFVPFPSSYFLNVNYPEDVRT
jgi:molybdenum cofactor guanylyltransferase